MEVLYRTEFALIKLDEDGLSLKCNMFKSRKSFRHKNVLHHILTFLEYPHSLDYGLQKKKF